MDLHRPVVISDREAQRRLNLSTGGVLSIGRIVLCQPERGIFAVNIDRIPFCTNGTPVRIQSWMENVQMEYIRVVAGMNTTTHA